MGGFHDVLFVNHGTRPLVDFPPDVAQRRVFHRLGQPLQCLVHHLELRANAEYDLHTFLFGHFVVRKTGRADVVYNLHAVQYHFTIDLVPPGRESDGQRMGAMTAQLVGKIPHVVGQPRYFVIKTVNLGRIADNRAKGVQIIVELPLQVGCGFHFLFRPYMSRSLHQHYLLLILQFLFRLVGVEKYHTGKHGIVLRLHLENAGTQ